MNDGLIPRRYAKALLKFAQEHDQQKRCYELMSTLAESFAENPDLAKAIANPYVDMAAKTGLLVTAAGAGKSDSCFNDFIKLLETNGRIDAIREIALAYQSLYRKANNIKLVEITTAAPLGKTEMDRLHKIIDDHIGGATTEYVENIDPDLIGGFVITIDSERLDASLQNELKQLRLKLLRK